MVYKYGPASVAQTAMVGKANDKAKEKPTGLTIATEAAQSLYLKRDPHGIAVVPVNYDSKQTAKRHCIRYVKGGDFINLDEVSKLPCMFSMSSSFQHYQKHRPSSYYDNYHLDVVCTVVDYAYYKNEWWIYLNSSRSIKTSAVCNYIYKVCDMQSGLFFTDEIPGGRKHTKRYDFTKLQHFKRCIFDIKNLINLSNNNNTDKSNDDNNIAPLLLKLEG